jgi:predicted amidohydrolase
MRVAAYQAPYLPFGSFDAVGLIGEQLTVCQAHGVDVLCCPEAVLGGLAHESDGERPADVALEVASGELADTLAPLMSSAVTLVVGFTERDRSGGLFSAAAVIAQGQLIAVQRKAYPGYRTVLRAGTELAPFAVGPASCGVVICNDLWYMEPARLLATAGVAVLFVPSHSGHLRDEPGATRLRARGENLPIARAVENTMSVVVADVAGGQGDRFALGCSSIIDPDGVVLARSEPAGAALLVADIDGARRPPDPRGWDGCTNPAVTAAFVGLWHAAPA